MEGAMSLRQCAERRPHMRRWNGAIRGTDGRLQIEGNDQHCQLPLIISKWKVKVGVGVGEGVGEGPTTS